MKKPLSVRAIMILVLTRKAAMINSNKRTAQWCEQKLGWRD